MKKKIWFIIIPIVLVVIIAVAIIVGLLLKKKNKEDENSSTGSKWGDAYYTYLKDAINEKDPTIAEGRFGISADMKDAKLQFCEVEGNQNPAMIITYKKDKNQYVNVYQVSDDNQISVSSYQQPTYIEYLYDIAKNKYSWYIHTIGNDEDLYSSLKNVIDKLLNLSEGNTSESEIDYKISKEEAETTQETINGETIKISKFDEIFVNPEIEQNKQIDFNTEINEEELKSQMTTAVKDYKKESEKITDEIKEKVSKKIEENKAKKESLEKAKEELTKKQAEEEAKKGITVGKYTIKYGKYIGSDGATGETIVFNADGTCQITATFDGNKTSTRSFTYKVGTYDFAQSIPADYHEGIGVYNKEGTLSYSFLVASNTRITDNDVSVYDYAGGASTSSTTSSSSNNTNNTTNSSNSNTSSKQGNEHLTAFEYDTSANNTVTEGTYYRDKDTGCQSTLEIKNSTGNSFDFSIYATYMTQSGYPNFGKLEGTAKATKDGNYVYSTKEGTGEYNVFFRLAGAGSNPTITIDDEYYTPLSGKTDMSPYCGFNVTFKGTYSK